MSCRWADSVWAMRKNLKLLRNRARAARSVKKRFSAAPDPDCNRLRHDTCGSCERRDGAVSGFKGCLAKAGRAPFRAHDRTRVRRHGPGARPALDGRGQAAEFQASRRARKFPVAADHQSAAAVYRFRQDGITPVASFLPDLYVRHLRRKTLASLAAANTATWRKLTEGEQQDVYKMDPETLERLRGLGYVN